MKKKETKINANKKVLILLGTVILVLLVGISYAFLKITIESKSINVIKSGDLSLNLEEFDKIIKTLK